MADSYPFPMYSGLFEPKHYKHIGSALWLFSWCINATTMEDVVDGEKWGYVFKKKPMKLSELAEPFGVDKKTIQRWLKSLEEHEYIKVTRAPYGLIIAVRNSKKFKERKDINVHSETRDKTDVSTHQDKNVHSNKDIINDFTATASTGKAKSALAQIEEEYYLMHSRLMSAIGAPVAVNLLNTGIPPDFIISVMKRVHAARSKKSKINCFSYYERPILEAWEIEQSKSETAVTAETTPSQKGTVANGPVALSGRQRSSSNKQAARNQDDLQKIREARERERERNSRVVHDYP